MEEEALGNSSQIRSFSIILIPACVHQNSILLFPHEGERVSYEYDGKKGTCYLDIHMTQCGSILLLFFAFYPIIPSKSQDLISELVLLFHFQNISAQVD